MKPLTLTKPSEVLQYILDNKLYAAYLSPAGDGVRPRDRRMCFAVESLGLSAGLELATKSAIIDTLKDYMFLHNLLTGLGAGVGINGPYNVNHALRRRALAHWRRLIVKLQEKGQ